MYITKNAIKMYRRSPTLKDFFRILLNWNRLSTLLELIDLKLKYKYWWWQIITEIHTFRSDCSFDYLNGMRKSNAHKERKSNFPKTIFDSIEFYTFKSHTLPHTYTSLFTIMEISQDHSFLAWKDGSLMFVSMASNSNALFIQTHTNAGEQNSKHVWKTLISYERKQTGYY